MSLLTPRRRPSMIFTGYGGQMLLRDAKEAFREGQDVSRRRARVSMRALSTKQGRADSEEAVVLDRVSRPPVRRRSGGGGGGSSSGGSKGGVKMGGALGLKEFMHRTRVLNLYRGIMKVCRRKMTPIP